MYGNQFSPMQQMPQQYQNPYLERLNGMMQPQMQQAQHYDIVQVNGRGGAEAFRMAPNSRCLLLDEREPIVWLAQTDGAGFATVTPYTITPYQQPDPQSDLMARLNRLEAAVYGSQSDSASAASSAQQTTGGSTAVE